MRISKYLHLVNTNVEHSETAFDALYGCTQTHVQLCNSEEVPVSRSCVVPGLES